MNTLDVHTLRDPRRPIPTDLRPLASQLQALDLDALDDEARGELHRILSAALSPLLGYRAKGWTRSSSRHPCPRVVAGKRCLEYSGRWSLEPCICRRSTWSLLDHARLWRTPDGPVLTAEPYQVDPSELAEFASECEDLGLRVLVSGASPYFPADTVYIEVWRSGPPPPAPPPESTTRAERRRMLRDRTCFVCRERVSERDEEGGEGGIYCSEYRILSHLGECYAFIREEARDYSRSKRGRLRNAGELRRAVEARVREMIDP